LTLLSLLLVVAFADEFASLSDRFPHLKGSFKERAVQSGSPFTWDNCDSLSKPWVSVMTLGITPNPIHLGSPITVNTQVKETNTIDASTWSTVGLTIETKTFGVWVEIPCIDGVGSCTLQSSALCAQLKEHAADNCPKLQPYGLPCQCPFTPNLWKTPAGGLQIQTKNPGLSWLTTGDFYVKAQLYSSSNAEMTCVEVYFSLG